MLAFAFGVFSWTIFLFGFDLREDVEEKRLTDSLAGKGGGVSSKKYNVS